MGVDLTGMVDGSSNWGAPVRAAFTYLDAATGTVPASAYGVVGDGTTDDTTDMQTALTSAATLGVTLVLPALSTVMVDALTIPTGCRLNLNGSTLKKTSATAAAMLTAADTSNILIYGGTIDGNLAGYAPTTEWRHGISLLGASNVTVHDITIMANKGDGVYVGVGSDGVTPCSNIVQDRVVCAGNWRNGMSITAVSGFGATDCWYSDTLGTNPQAGVDIEPNVGTVLCENITFTGCTFAGNGNFGLVVLLQMAATVHQGNIEIVGCRSYGNGTIGDGNGGGLDVRGSREFTMTGGSVESNTGAGVALRNVYNTKIVGANVRNNTMHGLALSIFAQALTIEACVIEGNGTGAAATYDGINLSPSSASTKVRLVGSVSTGASQRYGALTTANVSSFSSIGNDWSGNGTSATSFADDLATRRQVDSMGTNSSSGQTIHYATGSSTLTSFRQVGDTADRIGLTTGGYIVWGSGSASTDTYMSRLAVGVAGVAANQCFRTGVAITTSRPSASAVGAGSQFYDSTLHKPIWSDGTNWKDASGTTV